MVRWPLCDISESSRYWPCTTGQCRTNRGVAVLQISSRFPAKVVLDIAVPQAAPCPVLDRPEPESAPYGGGGAVLSFQLLAKGLAKEFDMPSAESQPVQPARLRAPPVPRPRRVPAPVEYPETDGKPMGESTLHIHAAIDAMTPLRDRYRNRLDAFVGGNLMMYYEKGKPRRHVSPDVFVAFGVPSEPRRPTWKVWEEGKLADFVLEVTSRTTQGNDEGPKRRLYQRLEVSEYWQFDPTGDYLNPKLKGHRLGTDGRYTGIALEEFEEGPRGRSEVLGLELRLEDDRLRFFRPRGWQVPADFRGEGGRHSGTGRCIGGTGPRPPCRRAAGCGA